MPEVPTALAGVSSPPFRSFVTRTQDGLDTVQWRRPDGAVRTARASPELLHEQLWETEPVRRGVQYQNRPNQHGLYYWPRTGRHVWYESALELACLVELDHQGEAVQVAAQPFRLLFRRGAQAIYHDPDFFAVHSNGDQVVYDVKPAHRRLPADTELAQAIAVLARAGQDAAWNRQQIANQLRSVLREYFPAAPDAFQKVKFGLASVEAPTVLTAAPTPARARMLTKGQLRKLLVKAGRQRGIDEWVDRLHHLFRTEQLRQLPGVETAFGEQARGLLLQLDAACRAADHLATETQSVFEQHPDAPILTSFPGLGALSGARVLGEIGDDRARFTDASNLRAYAGSAPVTRASGKSLVVMQRKVKNQRLAAAGYIWTFAALTASPHARAHYDRRRDAGDGHAAALRNLFNKFLGQLHHCLDTGQRYDPNHAFPIIESTAAAAY